MQQKYRGGILCLCWKGDNVLVRIFAVGPFSAVNYSDYHRRFETA